jgi:site-specific recombinase XerD
MIDAGLQCPPGKRREELCDTVFPGLYLEVRSTNACSGTFYYRYKADGKTCHEKIGRTSDVSLQEARKAAKLLKAKIALGANPQAEARAAKAVMTLKAFLEENYTPYAKARKRSFRFDETMMRVRIIPRLGHLRLNELTRHRIQSFHTELRAEGLAGSTCDHHVKFIRHALNLAVEWEMLEKNPAIRVPLYNEDVRVENFMTDEERARLMKVLMADRNRVVANLMRFLLATGARVGTALSAEWKHIDRQKRTWRVPAANNKSRRHQTIVLSDAAIEILDCLQTENHGTYLFLNPRTKERLQEVRKTWQRMRKEAGLDRLRIHDLRHEFASLAINSGRTLFEVQALLNHSSPQVTQRYSHLASNTLQDAVNSVAQRIADASEDRAA